MSVLHFLAAMSAPVQFVGERDVLSPASGSALPMPASYTPAAGDFVLVAMRDSNTIGGGSGGWSNFDSFTDFAASWRLYSKALTATDAAAWSGGTLTVTNGGASQPVFVYVWRSPGINLIAAVLNSSANASSGTSLVLTEVAMNANTVMAVYVGTDQSSAPTALTFSAGSWVNRASAGYGGFVLFEAYRNVPRTAGALTVGNYSASGNAHYGRLIEVRRA